MRRPCFILILFVLLGFGVSLAVPAEDVPETAYDESEALPFEDTPAVLHRSARNRHASAKRAAPCFSVPPRFPKKARRAAP